MADESVVRSAGGDPRPRERWGRPGPCAITRTRALYGGLRLSSQTLLLVLAAGPCAPHAVLRGDTLSDLGVLGGGSSSLGWTRAKPLPMKLQAPALAGVAAAPRNPEECVWASHLHAQAGRPGTIASASQLTYLSGASPCMSRASPRSSGRPCPAGDVELVLAPSRRCRTGCPPR